MGNSLKCLYDEKFEGRLYGKNRGTVSELIKINYEF
jgi:hypothetical protein